MSLLNFKPVKAAIIFVVIGISVSAYAGQKHIFGFDPGKDTATPASKIIFNKINPAISMGAHSEICRKAAMAPSASFRQNS